MSELKITIAVRDQISKQVKDITENLRKFRASTKNLFASKINLKSLEGLAKTTGPLKETRDRLKRVAETYKTLLREFSKGNVRLTADQFDKLQKASARLKRRIQDLNKVERENSLRLRAQAKAATLARKAFTKLTKGVIKKLTSNIRTLSSTLVSLKSALVSVLGPLVRIAAIASAGFLGGAGFIVKTTADFERFQLQIQAVNKDVIRTSKEFRKLREEAAASPLTTGEFVESFQRLRTLGISEARKTNNQLAQIAAVFGRDLRDVTSAFISLEARTLRRLGVQITRTTSKAIIQSGDVIKVVNNNVKEIRKGIRDVFQKRFPDAFKFLENSLSAQFNVIKSLIQDVAFDIGNVAIRKPLLQLLKSTRKLIEDNRDNIVAFFDVIANDTKSFVDLLKKTFEAGLAQLGTGGAADKSLGGITDKLIGVFVNGVKILTTGITGVAVNLAEVIITAFAIGGERLINSAKIAFNKFNDVDSSKIAEITKKIDLAKKTTEDFRKSMAATTDPAMIKVFKDNITGLNNEIGKLVLQRADEKGIVGILDVKTTKDLEKETTSRLGRLANRLKALNGEVFSRLQRDLAGFANDTVGAVGESITLANQLFAKSFVDGFNDLAKKSVVRRAIEDLTELKKVGKENLIRPIDTKNVEAALPSILAQIKELRAIAKDPAFGDKVNGLLDRIVGLEEADEKNKLVDFTKQIKVLQTALVDLTNAGKKADKLQVLVDLIEQTELLSNAKAKVVDFQKGIARAIDQIDIFEGKSLGTQLLDDNILVEQAFKDRITAFVKSEKDGLRLASEATGIKKAFERLVSKNSAFAKDTVNKLLEGAFKNIQLPTAALQSFERSTGKISELLRTIAKESLVSDAAVQKFFRQLKRGGGDSKLAKELLNDSRVLTQLNKILVSSKARVADFGKELNFLDDKTGKVSEAFLGFVDKISTVAKFSGTSLLNGFSLAPDPKKVLEAFRQMKATVSKFLDSEEFVPIRPDLVQAQIRDLKIPESLQAEFTAFQNSFKGSAANSGISIIGKKFKESVGEAKFAAAELVTTTSSTVEEIKSLFGQLGDESQRNFATFVNGLAPAKTTADEILGKLNQLKQSDTRNFTLGLAEGFNELNKNFLNFRAAASNAVVSVADSITNNLTNSIVSIIDGSKSAKEAFADFAKSLLSDVAQIIVKFIVLQGVLLAINALAAVFTGGASLGATATAGGAFGAFSQGFGSLFKFADGGIMQGNRIGGSLGGIASSPNVAVYGEGKGAEAFVPLPDNRKIPVELKGRGNNGPGQVVNVNMNYVVSAIDASGVQQFLNSNKQSITQTVLTQLNSNRAFKAALPGR